jgi:hypothetical protein
MSRLALSTLVLALIAAAFACSGIPRPGGNDEPIRVTGGQFRAGDMPGLSPLSDDAVDGGAAPVGPHVTDVQTLNQVVWNGEVGKAFSGHATADVRTVALRFGDLGTGYWAVNVDGPDPANGGELTWTVLADFGRGLPAGLHDLDFAAFDEQGRAGTQRKLTLCVAGVVPQDLSACDPASPPPHAVLSLTWDRPVDLDLRLVAPSGKTVDWHHPTTGEVVDGGVPAPVLKDPSTGISSVDAQRGCVAGGLTESVVWKGAPANGTYLVYVDLFDACSQPSVRFTVTLYLAQTQPDGSSRLVPALRKTGELGADQVSGGAGTGVYVTDLTFQ